MNSPSFLKFVSRSFAIACWLLFFLQLNAQPDLLWSQNYGGNKNDIALDCQATLDGGLILSGVSFTGNNDGNAAIYKLNTNGDLEWSETFGGNQLDEARGIVATSDGGYVIAASTRSSNGDVSSNNGRVDYWVFKINNDGVLQWSKNFGGENNDIVNSIELSIDGGFILAGTSWSPDDEVKGTNGGADAWILKLDANGNEQWSQKYGGDGADYATDIVVKNDGTFLFCGYTNSKEFTFSSNDGAHDAWVVKLANDGQQQWSKLFGGERNDHFFDAHLSNDNGYVLTGYSYSEDQGSLNQGVRDLWVLKIDNNGNEQWSRTFGGSRYDEGHSIMNTSEGYWIGGYTWSNDGDVEDNEGNKDFWLLGLNENGAMLWTENYGGSQKDVLQSICQLNDGGYALVGSTDSDNGDVEDSEGSTDFWVLKLEGTAVPFQVNLGNDVSICLGESYQLNANVSNCNDCSYIWNDGNTEAIRTITPTETANYSVTLSDSNGQMVDDEITITVNPKPPLSIESNGEVFCEGDMVTLNAGDPNCTTCEYNWSTGATGAELIFELEDPGLYIVTVTDANNCSATDVIDIGLLPLINVTVEVENVACFDASTGNIFLDLNGSSGFDFLWNNGATSQNLDFIPAGIYEVTITGNDICDTTIESIEVSEGDEIEATIETIDVSCGSLFGSANLEVEGGTGDFSYLWSNGSTEKDQTALSPGNYTVTITDANQCSLIKETSIDGDAVVTISSELQDVSCFGENNGSINLKVVGAVVTSYSWSDGSDLDELINLAPGNYSVTIALANGCEEIRDFEIEEPTEVVFDLAIENALCFEEASGRIELTVNGGSGDYQFLWSNGETSQNLTNISADDYEVTITSNNGVCQTLASATVLEGNEIEVEIESSPVICNTEFGTIELEVNGGAGDFTYQWSNGSTEEDQTELNVGLYLVTVTDGNDCSIVAEALIEGSTEVEVDLEIMPTVCFGGAGGAIDLEILDGEVNTYLWSTGATVEDLFDLEAGSYFVTLTLADGCEEVKQVVVPDAAEIMINGDLTNPSCFGIPEGSIVASVIGGAGGYEYSWSTGSQNPNLFNLLTGTYTLSVTDMNGCMNASVFEIVSPPALEVMSTIAQPSPGNNDGSILLNTTGGTPNYSYVWEDGTIGDFRENLAPGLYSVTITDGNDCTTEKMFTLDNTTSIVDIQSLVHFGCYPNPNDGRFNIDVVFSEIKEFEVNVYTVLGQKLLSQKHRGDEVLIPVDLKDLAAGIYWLSLNVNGERLHRRVVID